MVPYLTLTVYCNYSLHLLLRLQGLGISKKKKKRVALGILTLKVRWE